MTQRSVTAARATLVERLRTNKLHNRILQEAADEIERLRVRLDNWVDVNAEAGREIERLRAEVKRLQAALLAILDGSDGEGLLIGSGEMQEIARRALGSEIAATEIP